MNLVRFVSGLLSAVACLLTTAAAQTAVPAPGASANPTPTTAVALNPALPTLFIAGDSTAARNSGHRIQGWAVPFAEYFDPAKVNVCNLARGGRSSRTFITEGLWNQLLALVRKGDTVLIQFGHNDGGPINGAPDSERPLRARGSLKGIGEETEEIENILTKKHETVHTFGWYIRRMIADVKAKEATPILLSLTARNHWQDGKIERGLGSYRAWDRAIADAEGIQFLDLTRYVADEYQVMGEEKVKPFFVPDGTHLTAAGAESQAAAVVAILTGGFHRKENPYRSLLSEKGRNVPPDRIDYLGLPEPANPKLPTLMLIGDSTVRNGRGRGDDGKWGWGDSLGKFFDPSKVNIVNRAIGGLSSRTFLTQGHWERTRTLIKPGDFVLIQFGHNDGSARREESPAPSDRWKARGSLPGIGEETRTIDDPQTKHHEVVHTYGWYLRQYIHDAKAAGATPIVCSLIPRNLWQNGRVVRQTDTYAGWAKEVAAQEGVGFIDLNDRIARRYEALGESKVAPLFGDPLTHTTKEGADLNASIVVAGLHDLPGAPCDAFLLTAS